MHHKPQTVQELRAAIANGCREAATVYDAAAKGGLRGAARMADMLRADAERLGQ